MESVRPVGEPGDVASFEVTGELPGVGTTLLEASAGTGKTFTVGALVTRYVAEGVAALEEMLVITFGRAASQELRERVRDQLVEAERALGDPDSADRDNAVVAHLLAADAERRAEMRHRLRDALASFDTATIATTHQFCQMVLRSLGVAGDTDSGAQLVDNLDDLVVEVVDDLYLQRFGHVRERPPFDRACALSLGRRAVGDPQAVLAPASDPESAAGARVGFAQAVREEVERRKRRRGILSYDDLLTRLAAALEDDDAPARARMRERWRIVLVDEFQDTDPVQWQVLDRAFSGHARMVLIGDPKQAIYAFRGGDVVTYLAAARTATTQATLGTNWRSDAALLERLQVVLRGAALGHPEIVVRDVAAHHPWPDREVPRLRGAPSSAPFRLRRLPRDGFRLKRGLIGAPDAREAIADDCAADIAALLASEATWCGEPLQARQVAVLVGVRDHGLLVQRALARRGVPAVLAGGGHVFSTPAADQWLALLEALEQPHRSGLVRAAALTSFFGHTTAELDAGGERLTGRIADTLRGWALLLRGRGVAALVEAAEERGLSARVLAGVDGERLLTDLRHLAQLMHELATRDQLGLTALLGWFREEQRRTTATERPRRLDSDAAAVQIVTVHGSKGLQYPVTYLPFAYQSFEFSTEVALFHDDEGRRTLDVSGAGPAWEANLARHRAEEGGEELRDLYVALTRAQGQVVAWWAPTYNTRIGGLHRLLFGRRPGVAEVPDAQDVRDDEYAARVLAMLEELGGPVAEVAEPVEASGQVSGSDTGELAVRRFTRVVDTDWRRTSYSGLIRVEEEQALTGHGEVASEPEVAGLEDEPPAPEPGLAPATLHAVPEGADSVPSPMADLPAGAGFGSLVHAVLEHTDPEAPDLVAELRRHVAEQVAWWPVEVGVDTLAEALVPLHETPFGPVAPGWTLGRVPLRDRLRELEFELPLVGGDVRDVPGAAPRREVLLRDLAPLLRRHLPADDPLAPYADRLETPPLGDQPLRGYLSGSVDAVLRLHTDDGPRFVVVDYKTNMLGDPSRPLTAADYAPPLLAEAMLHSHYPLQAMLYCVVAHRYLRWRQPGYDPQVHLAGVLYLYVRGMCGPDTPTVDGCPSGVFGWRPPAALVVALSDLLDGVREEDA
ncbi:UvrD-helicase domain-containing protein [Nocardioides sp. zg-DK7169]|uniref:UvrD-helicase domain-containing protein n=1 Tax=Nocardioides sp. zg-DK7169 TaxID=2736600 RepID=UPI00155551CB|nr:UvrD-helicase domain-containing protein [Nocardioides sp. zg-DK7169]NPC98161.1 UvrD-helicase domain-containing protein [Nocardioides sp. zg-DK7169]